jgi:hypothetical protein
MPKIFFLKKNKLTPRHGAAAAFGFGNDAN